MSRGELLRFVTLASHEGAGLVRYRASLARFGITPDIVWTGKPYPGHLAAMRLLGAHLSALPAEDIVVFTDGFDVVLIRDPAELLAAYRVFDADIVLSAEPGFTWKLPGRFAASRRYPKGEGRSGMYRYLNSGGYVGKAGALAAMLADLDYATGVDCDQTLFNKWFLENPGRAALDHDLEIFASSACQSGLERKLYRCDGAQLVNTRTGGRPFFFHFPAENRLCTKHVLDMLPFELPRLPVRPRDRWKYVLNLIEGRPAYWLDRPAYPLEDIVGLLAFRLLPASIVAGLGILAWHAIA
ncbi:glycosyltransferase domain-containing protein [Stappia sp.]|uniref:glycosyltransferase domain-containing protein n=1 Tax=Stappia sp. TaxID=1870903 RepID=UPI003A9A2651